VLCVLPIGPHPSLPLLSPWLPPFPPLPALKLLVPSIPWTCPLKKAQTTQLPFSWSVRQPFTPSTPPLFFFFPSTYYQLVHSTSYFVLFVHIPHLLCENICLCILLFPSPQGLGIL
jgi:hypothetical protein